MLYSWTINSLLLVIQSGSGGMRCSPAYTRGALASLHRVRGIRTKGKFEAQRKMRGIAANSLHKDGTDMTRRVHPKVE